MTICVKLHHAVPSVFVFRLRQLNTHGNKKSLNNIFLDYFLSNLSSCKYCYTGSNCQFVADLCAANPCINGICYQNVNRCGLALDARSKSTISEMHYASTASATTCTTATRAFVIQVNYLFK
jgi:hypothetical protein